MTMATAKKLISMRVNEGDWGEFMAWAEDNGSNASAEINRFIRRCLGRSENDIQPVNINPPVNTETLVTKDDLSKEIEKAVTYLFQDLAHKSELKELGESVKAIADLTSRLEVLQDEVEALKKSEPIG